MVKRIPISINDNQRKNLEDVFVSGGDNLKPRGRVMIHERKVGDSKLYLVEDTSNLIVYRGRDWLLQRAFNKGFGDRAWQDRYISWLAVGTGGAVGGNPLTPTSPALPDYLLNTHGSIDSGSRYITVDAKEYHDFDSGYPALIHDTDVTETVYGTSFTDINSVTNPSDSVLIGLVKVTIASNECNGGSDPEDYQDISEAGLFTSNKNTVGDPPASGEIELFARVCFSTIRKNADRELVFSWYIFF